MGLAEREVDDLHLAGGGNQDVLGRDVAVDQADLLRFQQGQARPEPRWTSPARRGRGRPPGALQRVARAKLHRHAEAAGGRLLALEMVAIFGLATRMSCLNSRSARARTAVVATTSAATTLYATSVPVCVSRARQTSPVRPPPILSMGWKRAEGWAATLCRRWGPAAVAHVSEWAEVSVLGVLRFASWAEFHPVPGGEVHSDRTETPLRERSSAILGQSPCRDQHSSRRLARIMASPTRGGADVLMGTLGGFPNPPALWLRRAKPASADAIEGKTRRFATPFRDGSRPA